MKKAHIEGRAHNIGECRWNNKPSYPEQWFMNVIENEFTNKEYIREFPFHKYSLDFAWVKFKKCIEIDGEQHYRDKAQMIRDKAKDKLLKEEGWKALRLDWRWVYNNTKDAIKLAKEFIEC
jgi:very-short-patch-repair endonuclease